MKKRTHNPAKRFARLDDIVLRRVAVVHHSALADEEVRSIDLKHEHIIRLDARQAGMIADHAHPWHVFMAVMTTDKAMHVATTVATSPIVQADMVTTLEEEHEALRAEVKTLCALEGNGVEVHSYGWIATPRHHDIEPEQAERLFAVALAIPRRAVA